MTDDKPLTLREEIASLILIHNNGIGTRELCEAEEGTDHRFERQASLKAADAILDYLRTKEATEETIRRVIDKAFADAVSAAISCTRCNKRLSRKTARLIDGKLLCSACVFPPMNRDSGSRSKRRDV